MTIDELYDELRKCPCCGSDVNYIQTCTEVLDLDADAGEEDTDMEIEDLEVAMQKVDMFPGDLQESHDFNFIEIRCDDLLCCSSWENIDDYKQAVLEKLKKGE